MIEVPKVKVAVGLDVCAKTQEAPKLFHGCSVVGSFSGCSLCSHVTNREALHIEITGFVWLNLQLKLTEVLKA